MDNMKLFVYGTLKRGHGNSYFLRNATFVGRAAMCGVMYGAGIPIISVPDKHTAQGVGRYEEDIGVYHKYASELASYKSEVEEDIRDTDDFVIGEVYEVTWDDLRSVDGLEGFYGNDQEWGFYNRVVAPCQLDKDGSIEPVWVYVTYSGRGTSDLKRRYVNEWGV